MSEPLKPIYDVVQQIRDRAELLSAEHKVSQELDDWADEIEARLRAWDEDIAISQKYLDVDQRATGFVRVRLLGVPPKKRRT